MSLQALDVAARPKKPRLFQFLTWAGGLQPHPDLAAILDGKCGWMVRKSGMSLDAAREACIEEGFLIDREDRECEPSINDLLDLIAAEAGGHKQYRAHEAVDAYEWDAKKVAVGVDAPTADVGTKNREVKRANRSQPMVFRQMNPAEYKLLRKKLGLSNYALAPVLGISLASAQRYEQGKWPIPEPVAKLLIMLGRDGKAPVEWTRNGKGS
jgi:DNA-binding transcriptional regulator YiaG